ncbi:MAG: fasciclin domain-containing protein, partial [Candidatus Dadabacteria bacterium]
MRFNFKYLLLVLFAAGLWSCKKWEDHIAISNPDLSQNLLQAISTDANLSSFKQLVNKAGLDSVLQSSKSYTVWAPTNTALQGLDQAIVNDPVKLKNFVLNHIATQSYFTREAGAGQRVAMLNGKYNIFTSTNFEDATITAADKFVSNGVLHVINKAIPVLPNIWDFINSTSSQYAQNGFIASLNYTAFDPSTAIVDSISKLTGQPVYRPGTGLLYKNQFNQRVYDLSSEDKQYTYFVIKDAAFTAESDSLEKYYQTPSTVSTDSLGKWYVARDLVLEGIYAPSSFGNLQSKYGIPIPVNAADIVETRKLSNGVVYVLSNLHFPAASKFPTIRIEGETPSGFLSDKRSNTNYRVRVNPVTGQIYNDLLVLGHGVSGYYSYYNIYNMPSMKYKVYVAGVNDFQTGTFSENIIATYPGAQTPIATLTYAVPLSTTAGA